MPASESTQGRRSRIVKGGHMYELVYRSRAPDMISEAQIMSLVQKAAENNRQFHVTGLLLYDNNTFFQLLEGSETAVKRLFSRIQQDPRHTNVERFFSQAKSVRHFPQWSMARLRYQNLDDDRNVRELIRRQHRSEGHLSVGSRLLALLHERSMTPQ